MRGPPQPADLPAAPSGGRPQLLWSLSVLLPPWPPAPAIQETGLGTVLICQVLLQVLQPGLMGPGCHGSLCSLSKDLLVAGLGNCPRSLRLGRLGLEGP